MKSILRALLILTAAALVPVLHADYWFGDFVGDSTVVFQDGSPIYSTPDLQSQQLARLQAGTGVRVTGSAGEVKMPGGLVTYWYKVEPMEGTEDISGYMTGSTLAMTSLELSPGTLFMFNLTGFDSTEFRFGSSAVVLVNGEVADEIDFRPVGGGTGRSPYDYNIRSLPLDAGGLDGVMSLIQLSFIYEACGYLNRDVLFAWTGSDLVMGPNADSQFEAAEYTYIETFVTPSDSAGIPGIVRVRREISQWDEEKDDYSLEESSFTDYPWSGTGFVFPEE